MNVNWEIEIRTDVTVYYWKKPNTVALSIEALVIRSQLRWGGNVVWNSADRLPNISSILSTERMQSKKMRWSNEKI